MSGERDATVDWLASVLRSELPLREGPYALALRGVAREGGRVVASFELRAPPRPDDPPTVSAGPHVRALPLVPAAHAGDTARAEAFVRAWCATVRRALREVTTSPLPDAPWFGPADLGPTTLAATMLDDAALVTGRDFLAALGAHRGFARFTTVALPVARAALERVHDVITERPPLLAGDALRLRALTEPWNDDPPPGPSRGGVRVRFSGVVAGLELTLLDDGVARDAKQQELELVPAEHLGDLDRVEAYLRAWRDVLPERVALMAPDEVTHAMPHDLVLPAALASERARTQEDFRGVFARRWQFEARRRLRGGGR